jgi:hypothetical protein
MSDIKVEEQVQQTPAAASTNGTVEPPPEIKELVHQATGFNEQYAQAVGLLRMIYSVEHGLSSHSRRSIEKVLCLARTKDSVAYEKARLKEFKKMFKEGKVEEAKAACANFFQVSLTADEMLVAFLSSE